MAAQGENEQAESARASNTVWPPPPTCQAPKAAAPRWSRLLIPLSPFLAPFALPKWAKSAFNNLFFAIVALLMEHHAGNVGKILIGLLLLVDFAPLLSFLTWSFFTAIYFIRCRFSKAQEAPPVSRRDVVAAMGGWMGIVPFAAFWVWGLLYLAGDHIHLVNRVALIVWAIWFLFGCVVAVVNGVRYWLREWHMPRGTGYE